MTAEAHPPGAPRPPSRLLSVATRAIRLYRHRGWSNVVAAALSVVALVAIGFTYAAMSEGPLRITDPRALNWLLFFDVVLLLGLLMVVGERVVTLWLRRRSNRAGSRLHLRMVAIMALLAGIPAVLMAFLSIVFFQLGVQSWFSDKVSNSIDLSVQLADRYLDQEKQRQADKVTFADWVLSQPGIHRGILLQRQAYLDGLNNLRTTLRMEALAVVNAEGNVLAGSGDVESVTAGMPQVSVFEDAAARIPDPEQPATRAVQDSSRAVVIYDATLNQVIGLTKMGVQDNLFVLGVEKIDRDIPAYVTELRETATQFTGLEAERANFQLTVTLLFGVIAALFLVTAITGGLIVAGWFGKPLSDLIGAAERIRAGDLSVRLHEGRDRGDELGSLMRSFNRMTEQLDAQQTALVAANQQIDARRRLTEAILRGVSAGVLGLDRDARVVLANESALALLGRTQEALIGSDVRTLMPTLMDDLSRVLNHAASVTRQVEITDGHGQRRTLLLRLVAQTKRDEHQVVMTFDDITELLVAQRHAAWAGVARRIAHEIKNPLTPIQLSAERLKRRYTKLIPAEDETFGMLIDTVVRQVDTIRRLVDEFSAFARMPQPQLADVDLSRLVEEVVFTQRQAFPSVPMRWEKPDQPLKIRADKGLIQQALGNLLQNAAQAMTESPASHQDDQPGQEQGSPLGISVTCRHTGPRQIQLVVADQGPGIAPDMRTKVLDPYVTTREKGTGLGLAIVKKIIEDHGGTLELQHPSSGGLTVCFTLPLAGGIEATQSASPEADVA